MNRQQMLAVLVSLGMVGCGGSPSAPAMPGAVDRQDCGQFPPQSASPYILPYERGQALFAGRTIEHGDPQRYSIDWVAPMNTPVIAARSGRVMATESRWADTDHTFGHENYVFVGHDDGTVARYFHLATGGALVSAGEQVTQGQQLGRSGNSGNSTAPHLHFDVVGAMCPNRWPDNFGSACQRTMPITFRNTKAHPCGIQTNEVYEAR